MHSYVNYTFIFKKSFKYLKNFNETAADTVGSTLSNNDCTFFF